MTTPETSSPRSLPLPRYGIREDEMTRPGIVLFDWNGDDETVRIHSITAPDADDFDDEVTSFGPRWQGVGRRPGTVALAVVLGASVAIGVCALFAPDGAQVQTQSMSLSASAR